MKPISPGSPFTSPEARAWLRDHPDVDPAELEAVWNLAGQAEPFERRALVPDDRRVAALRARIKSASSPRTRSASNPAVRPVRRRLALVAAVVFALVAVGGGWWLRPVTLTAPTGTSLQTGLPDGSHVELNRGASLSYRRTFGWTRRSVRLDGEAFFDVVPGGRPFEVHTFNAKVTVLGTRFDVRAWPNDPAPATIVFLESGRVALTARTAPTDTVILEPGQLSRVNAEHPAPPVDVPAAARPAWRSGGFAFFNEPLASIAAEMERRFGVSIRLDRALQRERFTLTLDRAVDVETILDVICTARGCRYRTEAGGYLLEPSPGR